MPSSVTVGITVDTVVSAVKSVSYGDSRASATVSRVPRMAGPAMYDTIPVSASVQNGDHTGTAGPPTQGRRTGSSRHATHPIPTPTSTIEVARTARTAPADSGSISPSTQSAPYTAPPMTMATSMAATHA